MSQTKVKSGLLNFPDQTDFVKLPSGTTAQRPSSPEKGYSRYNTTNNKLEFWDGTEWQQLPGLTPPIITSISYPGDDLAADPDGGQTITINGGDFKAGATVTVDGTTPSVITFVSAAEITFTAPAKTAGDYDIVVTNVDGANATAVDGMTYNGLPSWTTPAGNLGTFAAGSTIPTITLVATEPDSGVVSYSVTTGALPSGLTLTDADIDGTVPFPAGETTYNFSITASDDENQESTERAFNIVVYLQVTNTVDEVDPFGDSSGVALYKLEPTSNAGSHRYWRYTVGSSTNHHPRVSKIYLVKSDGSKENFVSFTSDNCSDTGDIPTQGTVYDIDLGSDDEAIGSGFYVTFGGGERNINYTLSYSDDNANWNIASSNYVNANACGEWNNAIQIAKDETDNYNGTTTSVGYKKGVFGQAGIFNGSSSKISNSNIVPLSSATEMSVSIWFKRYDTGVQRGVMSIGQDGAPGGGIFLLAYGYSGIGSGELFFELGSGIGRYIFTGTTDTNKWYHIAISCDGNTVNNYLNGSLQGSSSQGIGTIASSAILNIGGMNVSGGKYHNGEIDQTRIFNRALTPLEVESLYRERTVVCGGQADTLDILGDNSCIATYQLNGNANDLSGNYSGTPTDVSYGVGEFDLAGVFNGSGYVSLPFNLQGTPFSVSFWAKDTLDSNNYYLIANNSGSTQAGWHIGGANSGGTVYNFRINNGSSNYVLLDSAVVDDTNWHHVVVTWDNTTNANGAKIYINGTLSSQGTSGSTSNFGFTNATTQLMREPNGGLRSDGQLDQVRIFNKALNSTEVTTLYNETACDVLACSGTTNTLDILSDGSCVAAYPLDGSPTDLSGNYNGVQTDVTYPVGKYDLAGYFNGGSDIDISSITFPLNNFSYSLWFKADDISTSQVVFNHYVGGSSYGIQLNNDANIGSYFLNSSGGTEYLLNNTTLDYNWHHIVITKGSTNGHIMYYDNVAIATDSSFTGNVYNNLSTTNKIGRTFKGQIDQVRIFNKELSAGEVTTLYNETACN